MLHVASDGSQTCIGGQALDKMVAWMSQTSGMQPADATLCLDSWLFRGVV